MDFRSHYGFSSSPNTSDDAESHRGSPDTKLTVFSPEDVSMVKKTTAGEDVDNDGPPAFTIRSNNSKCSPKGRASFKTSDSQDPFITVVGLTTGSRNCGERPKLSPTASSFTPFGAVGMAPGAATTTPGRLGYAPSTSTGVSFLNTNSLPDGTSGDTHLKQYLQSVASEAAKITPIGQRPASGPSTPTKDCEHHDANLFSVDTKVSRSLIIGNVSRKTSGKELSEFFDGHMFPSLKGMVLIELNTNGIMYLGFTDIRDAEEALKKATKLRPEWVTQYFPPNQFALKTDPGSTSPVSVYEGQVMVRAHYGGQSQRFNAGATQQLVKELLDNYGDIKVFRKIQTAESPVVEFHAEFYDTTAANVAVASVNGFKIGGCTITVTHHEPDVVRFSPRQLSAQGAPSTRRFSSDMDTSFAQLSLGTRLSSYDTIPYELSGPPLYARPSPTGRSTIPREDSVSYWPSPPFGPTAHSYPRRDFKPYPGMYGAHHPDETAVPFGNWDMFGPGAIGQERGQMYQPHLRTAAYSPQRRGPPRFGGRHTHDFASGHHNVVDVERIRRGLDVRTTIMLRNIPNKIDQAMLKEIVDETSVGKYDFMYLRIDFANNCNVGYAFINFEDPWFIIDFVNARAGLRWNRFNSDKVAEVSYATIQGKDCLVQKFRNSSVMLEHPSFRPKIFHTGTGSLAGKEDILPGPDNPSKMRRSVENAEHVGLFAPRAGQHFRDEQRRRRSQYDRGTRLAELEDSYDYGTHGYHGEEVYRPSGIGSRQYGNVPDGYNATF